MFKVADLRGFDEFALACTGSVKREGTMNQLGVLGYPNSLAGLSRS